MCNNPFRTFCSNRDGAFYFAFTVGSLTKRSRREIDPKIADSDGNAATLHTRFCANVISEDGAAFFNKITRTHVRTQGTWAKRPPNVRRLRSQFYGLAVAINRFSLCLLISSWYEEIATPLMRNWRFEVDKIYSISFHNMNLQLRMTKNDYPLNLILHKICAFLEQCGKFSWSLSWQKTVGVTW